MNKYTLKSSESSMSTQPGSHQSQEKGPAHVVLVLFSLLEVFRLQLLIMEPYENGTIAIVKPVNRVQIDAAIEVKSDMI